MSTRKFVSIVVSALVVFVLVVFSFGLALADDSVRSVEAVVVSCKTTPFGYLEVGVVDTEGELWFYYADEAHIGERVVIVVLNNIEIIDAVSFDFINSIQEVATTC